MRTTDSQTQYRVEIPALTLEPGEWSVITPGSATVTTSLQQRDVWTRVVEMISVPNKSSIERVIVEWDDGRGVLYLPSVRFRAMCESAIRGDTSAARSVINAVETPIQIPLLCGAFLKPDEVVELVDAVTSVDRYVASTIHSYRYPILRSALVNETGLSVTVASDFEVLVDGLDLIGSIGSVSMIDSVADTMLTSCESVTEAIELLETLGYDPAAFEQRGDGRFFACVLAHVVLTAGVSAARGHTVQRRRRHQHFEGHYERKKTEASMSSHNKRGEKWRRLVYPAASQPGGEFRYVLANALYWTGHTVRSDSRVQELLYRAASVVVERIDIPKLAGWAKFEWHVAAGHRLRSRHQFKAAERRFTKARQVAQRYTHLPEWQAQYSGVVVRAHRQSDAGEHEAALETLDDGMKHLLRYDLQPETATRIIHHLKGQHCEIAQLTSPVHATVRSGIKSESRVLVGKHKIGLQIHAPLTSRDQPDRKRQSERSNQQADPQLIHQAVRVQQLMKDRNYHRLSLRITKIGSAHRIRPDRDRSRFQNPIRTLTSTIR
jgi:pterin-4a-carbinolamine dehydratase